MYNKDYIKIGRGHDSEVRITDISVSRCHALIKKTYKGAFTLEDNSSKFGTLVLVRKPIMLENGNTTFLQAGRTILEIQVNDPNNGCSFSKCIKQCFKGRGHKV